MVTLVAICLGGLENQVIDDIARVAPAGAQIRQFSRSKITTSAIDVEGKLIDRGECGCGKILVSGITEYKFIHDVRSVQHWLVYLSESTSVPSKKVEGIELIQSTVPAADVLNDAISTWKSSLSNAGVVKFHDLLTGTRPAKFCVRTIRDGEHEYSSLDVACKIGESVLSKTNWTVDLVNMDFEIIALVLSETLLIGINIPTLSPPFLKSRMPGEIRPPVVPSGLTSGMRPSTAYLLVQLAKPQPGDVLVDAMCGGGAAFVEAAYSHGCIAIGGDVDRDLQSTLLQSVQLAGEMSNNKAVAEVRKALVWCSRQHTDRYPMYFIQVAWWGAPKLPFIDGSVDIVMLDMPFGRVSKAVPKYYAKQRVPKVRLTRVPFTVRIDEVLQSVYCNDHGNFYLL